MSGAREGSMAGFEPTWPVVHGVRLADCAPIGEVFLGLEPGLVVLYGRNGAGKTRVLEGLEAILSNDVSATGERDLYFSWPPPAQRVPMVDYEYTTDVERLRAQIQEGPKRLDGGWGSSTGNPWVVIPNSESLSHQYIDGGAIEDFERWKETFDDLVARLPEQPGFDRPLGPFVTDAARWLAFGNEFFIARPPAQAAMVAAACVEVAQQGRFRLSDGPGRRQLHERVRQLRMVATATADTPFIAAIRDAVRAEHLERLQCDGGAGFSPSLHRFGTMGFGFESVEGSFDADQRPWWSTDSFPETGLGVAIGAPAELVTESADRDLSTLLIDAVERRLGTFEGLHESVPLVVEHEGGYRQHPALPTVVDELVVEANKVLGLLLEHAPRLAIYVEPLPKWPRSACMSWRAFDQAGIDVSLEQLSRAELRWSRFAAAFAMRAQDPRMPLVIVIDEPEAALHRRAERFLANGIATLAHEHRGTVVLATHSPAFLDASIARLHHVHRDPAGMTSIEEMPASLRSRIDELGLDPSDLLQYCRTIVLVEGEHDAVIIDELFRSELAAAGAELFPIRGLKGLKTTADAQLLLRFTNSRLLIVLDNENSERINDIWTRACLQADGGGDALPILDELRRDKWSAESKFLHEYMSVIVNRVERSRISFCAMGLPDIVDYLPLQRVAPLAPVDGTWASMRATHATAAGGSDFKKWLAREHGGDYGTASLRAAVQSLDSIHPDFAALLDAITARS